MNTSRPERETQNRVIALFTDPADLKGPPPPPVHDRFYVDECHRTQGGDMNKQMKRWLENAIFIGFTGTPLLKKDAAKLRTQDIFGTYIHT